MTTIKRDDCRAAAPPNRATHLPMRSWMIAFVTATLALGWLAELPAPVLKWGLLAAALPAALLPASASRFLSGLACGCALGLFHGEALLLARLPHDCEGQPVELTGRVASLPQRSRMPDGTPRQRFEVLAEELQPRQCRGPRKVAVSLYGDYRVRPGERWRFTVKIRRPWGLANPGSYNAQAWFAERGIDAVGSVPTRGTAWRLSPAVGVQSLHHRLRQQIAGQLAGLPFDASVRGVLAAVTVADDGAVGEGLQRLFRLLGISHLLVISGLHVGLVAAVGYLGGLLAQRAAVPLTGLALPLAPLLSLSAAAMYSALAGFSLPTQRALFMLCAFALAPLLGRRGRAPANLLLAAVLVLLVNPLAGIGSSFWLSFGAVAALLWLARWHGHASLPLRALRTHGYMALVMLPLGGWFFGGGSLAALFANLLMIPLLGLWVVPLALLGVVAHLSALSACSEALWGLAAWPLARILPVLVDLSEPLGPWLYRPVNRAAVPVALGLVGCLLVALPGRTAQRLAAGALLVPLLLPASAAEVPERGVLSATVLDVGQGTAVVLRGGGRTLLYDTGAGIPGGTTLAETVVIPYLRARGVRALDTFVVSHGDHDHSAGLQDILAAYAVGRLRYGGDISGIAGGRRCETGETWRWPDVAQFKFLSPGRGEPLKSNDASCVLLVENGAWRLLLPGDVEASRERELVRFWGSRLAADWLLAPHHGSSSSSSHTLLKHVTPRVAVVSSGYQNRFGHPHAAVVRRLQAYGAEVFNTAVSGAMTFHFYPGGELRMQAHRQRRRHYWM